MEKFAVDLDKVLDEFEFNEDRAEQLANVLPKRRQPAPLSQTRHQNLASGYRCTSYEPINLAAADFAVAPASRNKLASETPQQWNVKNTLQQPGSETDSEGSETDSEAAYSVPNNINETKHIAFYDNNSFKEEYAEHKPSFTANQTFPDQVIEPKWLQKSQDKHGSKKLGISTNTSKVNVSGVFSSLNEYMNAGASSKINARDIKTVSNKLTVNKIKNLDKNTVENQRQIVQNPNLDVRNLPDVASTSNFPTLQSSITKYDLPNNTFDLVTNLSSEQDITFSSVERLSSKTTVPNDQVNVGTVTIKSSENMEALNNIFETSEMKNISNISTNQHTSSDIPSLVDASVPTENDADGMSMPPVSESGMWSVSTVDAQCSVENPASETTQGLEEEKGEAPQLRPAVGFKADDTVSDSALLSYLQDLEDEFDQGSTLVGAGGTTAIDEGASSFSFVDAMKQSEDGELAQNANLFRHGHQDTDGVANDERSAAIDGVSVKDNDLSRVAITGQVPEGSDKLDLHSHLEDSSQEKTQNLTVNLNGDFNSLHSDIEQEVCDKSIESFKMAVNGNIELPEHRPSLCSSIENNCPETSEVEHPSQLATDAADSKESIGFMDLLTLIARSDSPVPAYIAGGPATLCSSIENNSPETSEVEHPSQLATDAADSKESIGLMDILTLIARSDSPVPAYIAGDPATLCSSIEDSSPETLSEVEHLSQLATEEFDSDVTSLEDGDEDGRNDADPMPSVVVRHAPEIPKEVKRTGIPIVEVRSPMVQSPRDGSAIHVLGEEERPTRPKYLFLPSKITMGSAAAGEASSDDEALPASLVGPPGATPHAYSGQTRMHHEVTDNQTLEENQNIINTNQTSYDDGGTTETLNSNRNYTTTDGTANEAYNATGTDNANTALQPDDNRRPTVEQLDNQANINLAADADGNLSSPDYSESSVETLSPPAVALAPDPASLSTLTDEDRTLGFVSPFWIPDNEASTCMLCFTRFTVIRRRHHCRACGKVLCSKCCNLKARLEYMDNAEGRVCQPCHAILLRVLLEEHGESAGSPTPSAPPGRQPHPNNPMDYCSTIPPLQQVAGALQNPTPSVLVPVGVLKRQGSTRPKSDVAKQVMFSDGIRPGGDLTELDGSAEPRVPFRRPGRVAKRVATPPGPFPGVTLRPSPLPPLDPKTHSYIPSERGFPPVATLTRGELKLDETVEGDRLMASLKSDSDPPVMFAINRNYFVKVKILDLSCCVKLTCWCFSTQGLRCVSQDEIVLLLEMNPDEVYPPRDVFCYFNTLYQDAAKGCTVTDLGCTLLTGPFLGSTDHGAFVYIRPSFQCLQKLVLPTAPYLVAILVHRSETPWARVFPIRLVLRLGADSRHYPCSLVSVRGRKSVYHDIGHTIMNLLADFRNLSYTLPSVRGLVIHMEERQTTILLPKNGYDQVTRALNNSNEHVLALAANLSLTADSHLICMQSEEDLSYHTQAIHSKPRKVTGASFVVFNGALKTSSNLTAKSRIVEDGLMVQITPDTMAALRTALRNMKDWSVGCGPMGASPPDEMVNVQWVEDDKNFNIGVRSVIDGRNLDGVPSIRVHNGTDYLGRTRLVRWTEVFILQTDDGGRTGDPLDVGRLSETIARAVCHALVKLLDLLAQANYTKFAIRASILPDNVSYEGGSRGETLPPIYMNSLDNELVPVLHAAVTSNENTSTVLELVFHILLQ